LPAPDQLGRGITLLELGQPQGLSLFVLRDAMADALRPQRLTQFAGVDLMWYQQDPIHGVSMEWR